MNLLEALASKNIEDWRDQQVPQLGPPAPNLLGQMLQQPQSQGILSALLGFHDIPSASLLGQIRGWANNKLSTTDNTAATREYEQRRQEEMLAQRQYLKPLTSKQMEELQDLPSSPQMEKIGQRVNPVAWEDMLAKAPVSKNVEDRRGQEMTLDEWDEAYRKAGLIPGTSKSDPNYQRVILPLPDVVSQMAKELGYDSIGQKPRPRPKKKDD